MRVLFIGSDRDIVYMTAKILRRNQHEVSAAIGRAEAFEMLKSEIFDLVLFDCDMGEKDRNEIIKTVKSCFDAPSLMLISEKSEDEIPLLEAGADDWVKKPYKMEVLLARMAALIRKNRG